MKDSIGILRFATAGSVDDGKSTLIGRLLYDSKGIFSDQLEALENDSKLKNQKNIDLAHLTDGLKDEREQGITIDVAYRYFSTTKRKFIIADTPGHEEYTRNMFTGASNSNLAIILIDSRKGVLEQSRRHLYISYLLGIKDIIVAVNKMDLIEYSEKKFFSIKNEFNQIAKKLSIKSIKFIPISALHGDMIVKRGDNLPWYKGETLLSMLENTVVHSNDESSHSSFPIQLVSRVDNDEINDFRGYMGMTASGEFKIGDKIRILPGKKESEIKNIIVSGSNTNKITKNQSGTLLIKDELQISRGDTVTSLNYNPKIDSTISAQICWMSDEELNPNKKYLIKHSNKISKILIKQVVDKINIESLEKIQSEDSIKMNDIGNVIIKVQNDIVFDTYESNKVLGSFIILSIYVSGGTPDFQYSIDGGGTYQLSNTFNVGANNAASSMSTVFGAKIMSKLGTVSLAFIFVFLGASLFGEDVVATVGRELLSIEFIKLNYYFIYLILIIPILSILAANKFKIPIATTHIVVCTIFGIGLGFNTLNIEKMIEIVAWWIATPIAIWLLNYLIGKYIYFELIDKLISLDGRRTQKIIHK